MGEVTLSKTEHLDNLTREIYGCSFDEVVIKAMSYGFDKGLSVGSDEELLEGHRIGRTDGWRKAKGLNNRPKRRGKPSVIADGVATLMVLKVSEAQKNGIDVEDAVRQFLEAQEVGQKVLNDPSLDDAMIDFLDAQELRKKVDDPKILASVSAIKRILEVVQKELAGPRGCQIVSAATRTYRRIRRKGRSPSSLQHSMDEALRHRIDLLQKQRTRSDT
jgi:hypothetical protein